MTVKSWTLLATGSRPRISRIIVIIPEYGFAEMPYRFRRSRIWVSVLLLFGQHNYIIHFAGGTKFDERTFCFSLIRLTRTSYFDSEFYLRYNIAHVTYPQQKYYIQTDRQNDSQYEYEKFALALL